MDLDIYGIGNPLIDILVNVTEDHLKELGLNKGTMHLIDMERRTEMLKFIGTEDKVYSCGGSCPNTMIALSAFGMKAALAGKIGNDSFGNIYEQQISEHNIVSELRYGDGATGSSIIMVSPDTERTMSTYLGINRQFCKADIDTTVIELAKYFYFTGYMWDTDLQKESILHALKTAENTGTKIIFDVADPFAVNRNREEFITLIRDHVDIVFANREEARIMFHTENPEESAKTLSELCDIAIVKNGHQGSIIQTGSELIRIPVNPVTAVDTTGAGDMYAAGFIYGLCRGFSLEDSGICASFLASQIVTSHGAQFTAEQRLKLNIALESGSWNFTKL